MLARLALLALVLLLSSVGAVACEIDCIPHVIHCHKVLIQTDEASPQLSQAAVPMEFNSSVPAIVIPALATATFGSAPVLITFIVSPPLLRSTVFRI